MPRIFISYRRQDSAGHSGRLYDALTDVFPADDVFMDVDAIDIGVDFAAQIRESVGACDVLLAVIGPGWLDAADRTGARRLDDANDFVRLEIAAALERDVRVVPVLIGQAQMPLAVDLPAELDGLVRRHAVELSDLRWRHDIERLVRALRALDRAEPSTPAVEVEVTPQPDRSQQPAPMREPRPEPESPTGPGKLVGAIDARPGGGEDAGEPEEVPRPLATTPPATGSEARSRWDPIGRLPGRFVLAGIGALAAVVVVIAVFSGGGSGDPASSALDTGVGAEVVLAKGTVDPSTVTISAGQTIQLTFNECSVCFANLDRSGSGAGAPDRLFAGPYGDESDPFSEPGTFRYEVVDADEVGAGRTVVGLTLEVTVE